MYIFHRKVQMPFLLKYHIVLLYVCVFSHNSVSCPRKTVYCTIHGSAKTICLPSLSILSAIALLHFGHWSNRTLQVSHTILCPHGLNVALATSSLHAIHGTTSRADRSCRNGSPVTVACAFCFLCLMKSSTPLLTLGLLQTCSGVFPFLSCRSTFAPLLRRRQAILTRSLSSFGLLSINPRS